MTQVLAGKLYQGREPIEEWIAGKTQSTKIPNKLATYALERSIRFRSTSGYKQQHGSGVIVETNLVLTNFHLIGDLNFANDHPADLAHFDIRFDLAALTTKTRRLKRVNFQNRHFRTQEVFYVGNPEEWNKSVSPGVVIWHSKTRIHSSNPPAMGMSGSGLYDAKTGSLVGIVDSMEGSEENGCNFTVAVPSSIVSEFYKETVYKLRKRG